MTMGSAWAQARRPADASGRASWRDAAALRRDDAERSGARPEVDLVERQFYADGPDRLWVADITFVPTWSRVFVSGDGARCVFAPRCWLGDGDALAHRADSGGAEHGDHAAAAVGGDSSFGSRLPVHELRLRQAMPRGRRHALDGIGWGCVRQCDGRELFRLARARTAEPASVQKSGRSEDGGIRMDRRLVQPSSASFLARVSLAGQL